ncbi:YdeI/OmpD-associated family protein [Ferruginibacter albus]|uniref:YdeI/OmpD-associated family protein n=1 Tax=Ferruginibacter albus TaxID=2875540 RepID=UPI001CC3348C|nr:YdeI/OmpD-associated family protein [Ferruginibacter albus]UAY51425.1 YdeI/OmpD-associated family protein [Ferruginibacter albus]
MVRFTTTILQFAEQGEKTGWTYIELDASIAQKLKPGNKKSFRVKGKLDDHPIKGIALMPMGDGKFIMALNATIRKEIGKRKGATLKVAIEEDKEETTVPQELLECLQDEPKAFENFKKLTKGHQNYYGNWIKSAKTEPTKAKRIAQAVNALSKGWHFGIMMQMQKKDRKDLLG